MIEKSIINKEFFDFMSDHDTSWTSISKLEPLAVLQIYYLVSEMAQLMKLSSAENTPIDVSGDSEFLKAVKDKNSAAVWAILDDLLDTLKATAPRVYESVLRKIKEL